MSVREQTIRETVFAGLNRRVIPLDRRTGPIFRDWRSPKGPAR